jgi:CubicO group peptidase (beta-lactamase class C family)
MLSVTLLSVTLLAAYKLPHEGGFLARRREAQHRAAVAAAAADDDDAPITPWSPLVEQLDGWHATKNFAVTVGNASGVQFEYTHGDFSLHTEVQTASTSKWPMAMMFTGMVADGTISSLDAFASDYVPWWTKDRTCQNASLCDAKGNITVRHLLSFTSGFDDGEAAGGGAGAKTCLDDSTANYEKCAQEIYNQFNLTGSPGETFGYNSLHLNLMGAIATHASGLGVQAIFQKYYVEPYGMNETTCDKVQCSGAFLAPALIAPVGSSTFTLPCSSHLHLKGRAEPPVRGVLAYYRLGLPEVPLGPAQREGRRHGPGARVGERLHPFHAQPFLLPLRALLVRALA